MAEVTAALEQVMVTSADQQRSIAVLPFANMSRDADDEFFSDGLAEEIDQPPGSHPQPQGHRAHVRLRVPGQGARHPYGSPRRSASEPFSKAASAARGAVSA